MDPTSIGYASLYAQGAGGVFGALGSFLSAVGNQAMLRGQADIAEINARIEEGNAQATLLAGQRSEQMVRLKTGALKGRQRATLAANGVDLGQGSAARVLTDTDIMGEIDANQVKANAVRDAWGYRVKATNLNNEALTKRGAADAVSPFLAGATSLMGSATSVARSWYDLEKATTRTTGDFAREDRASTSASYWGP